jgi:hypothetical protein
MDEDISSCIPIKDRDTRSFIRSLTACGGQSEKFKQVNPSIEQDRRDREEEKR